MLTMPKCHDCGKFCRPVEWQMIYSGALPEPQEEIYKCTSCVERHGSFEPQPGIKPEHSCGHLTHNANWRRLHPAARIAFDPFWAARLWLAFWFPGVGK